MKDYYEVVNAPKWVRSTDGVVAGVFEGLGKRFDMDPNVLRLIWVISVLFFGSGLLIYLLLAWVLPREDQIAEYQQKKVLGVCRSISRKSGVELGLVRLLAVGSLFISFGLTFVAYLVFAFVMPEEESNKLYF
ncbi:MAG: PspC domain-containing protein [Bacteriovoracaceae bacterium]|nr:PspC domain-containing protein [Bacteriovoracaceae bacterium]